MLTQWKIYFIVVPRLSNHNHLQINSSRGCSDNSYEQSSSILETVQMVKTIKSQSLFSKIILSVSMEILASDDHPNSVVVLRQQCYHSTRMNTLLKTRKARDVYHKMDLFQLKKFSEG